MKVKTLRMPEKLEKILEEKAKEECRSFSAEVIKRVLDSLMREGITV
ncbi:Arc family DNA-binding protein [Salmonella enterica subsp. enterica serovar Alachua]|uniref:Arc family DNA-binding protein n=2 Tax=Salmonella enterica I TaxID=59201 RepID=A0A5W1I6L4_SALET|nr:Arc family DNA-binding protein [Salmonella enterica]EAA7302217.1 Arc family DNA-binding protein [Salmonella enterica subsp. arizonae]EAA7638686.1 Arc family DNA-binding protein [Salmonella enterica subsp. enterica]EBC8085023.1 Arc family DNA-binding protein [Salmonella enterica subsp. enterica serovar Infantis]EBC9160716.1 Arc family DNA-binding protein [Salmonella enterica subsp. enterica serovar Heidelberg]EBH8461012.1 Arc family DNA-binding protein [Salmonella enterica subsp. enterica se